jgi:hypothetical protein
MNVNLSKPFVADLSTGRYTLSAVTCVKCAACLGWRYDRAIKIHDDLDANAFKPRIGSTMLMDNVIACSDEIVSSGASTDAMVHRASVRQTWMIADMNGLADSDSDSDLDSDSDSDSTQCDGDDGDAFDFEEETGNVHVHVGQPRLTAVA